MSEPLKIAFTALATLLGGLLLLILTKLFVEPAKELRKLIGEIGHHVFLSRALIENVMASDLSDPVEKEELEKASNTLKALSAQLRASVNVIPLFWLLSSVRFLPSKERLLRAAGRLSVISYAGYEHDKTKVSHDIEELFRLLRIRMYEKDKIS